MEPKITPESSIGSYDLVELKDMDSSKPFSKKANSENVMNKVNKKADELFGFQEIARGGIKIVWVKRSSIPSSDQAAPDQYVYYTAIHSLFGKKRRELQEEYAKMSQIGIELQSLDVNTDYLAVDVQEMQREEQVNGEYTLQVLKATSDFEKKLRNNNTTLEERIVLGGHFLQGLQKLHKAGFAHGDLKPENCLIFEKMLRISDFGKTKKVKDAEGLSYWGNLRFVCPEGEQSKKGDVYSAALILIRDFEERYLGEKTSLITIDAKNRDFLASPIFRGIEKYLVENKAFLGCNRGLSVSLLKRHLEVNKLSKQDKENQSKEIHRYIDALSDELKKDKDFPTDQIKPFCDLLKKMTLADPAKRISSEEAAKVYQNIFKGETTS